MLIKSNNKNSLAVCCYSNGFKLLLLVPLLIVLLYGSSSYSGERIIVDDAGLADSIIIDIPEIIFPDPIEVPVRFFTDQPLSAIEITLKQSSPDLVIDSFSFLTGRVDYLNLKGFTEDDSTIIIFAFVSDEALIAAGPGQIGTIHFSPLPTFQSQQVTLDTTTILDTLTLIEHANFFLDSALQSYIPKYHAPPFWIRTTCCIDTTGNVDGQANDNVDIGDITALISFLFISQNPPPCMAEANIDGTPDGTVDIGDLTRLIGYLFIDAQNNPLAPCL